MGLIDQYNLRRDEILMRRFIAACENAASDAVNEAATVDNHAARIRLGRMVLDSEKVAQQLFSRYIQLPAALQNGTAIADAQLQAIANIMFERVALDKAKEQS